MQRDDFWSVLSPYLHFDCERIARKQGIHQLAFRWLAGWAEDINPNGSSKLHTGGATSEESNCELCVMVLMHSDKAQMFILEMLLGVQWYQINDDSIYP